VEGSVSPHLHGTTQIQRRSGKRRTSSHSNFPPVIPSTPVANRRRLECDPYQECIIQRKNGTLRHMTRSGAQSGHGKVQLAMRALQLAFALLRIEGLCQGRAEHREIAPRILEAPPELGEPIQCWTKHWHGSK